MKRGYHHGNLREALVEAALGLITLRGPQGFALSDAAKAAAVTPAAVYRHFAGRDELLAEVARQGFGLFAARLEKAWNDAKPSRRAAFEATGQAWLSFARSYPGHYQAMFESGLKTADHPALAAAAAHVRQISDRAAAAMLEILPPARRPPPAMVSAHIQALNHGMVELYLRGNGGLQPWPVEDLLEAAIGIYLRGLGVLEPDH